jgi:hypothetical protein
MYYDLTKSQKKIARRVMDKGIENHYIRGLTDTENILKKWRKSELSITDAYMQLYKSVQRIDKHIGSVYNDKGGSRWVEIMAIQLADGVISLDDLADFEDDVREIIIRFSGIE